MKVLIGLLLAITLVVAACFPCFAQSYVKTGVASVTVEAPSRVGKNQIFVVDVTAHGVWGLAGFQINIEYDRNVLHLESIEEGNFLAAAGGTYWFVDDCDPGNIQGITCVRTANAGVNGSGVLFAMKFKARRRGTSPIKLAHVLVADPTGRVMNPLLQSCVVRVTDHPAWDVNQDGVTNVLDLILICVSFGKSVDGDPSPNPDVNRDGIVSVLDLILAAQHFLETNSAAPPRFATRSGISALREALAMIDGDTVEEGKARSVISTVLAKISKTKLTRWAVIRSAR